MITNLCCLQMGKGKRRKALKTLKSCAFLLEEAGVQQTVLFNLVQDFVWLGRRADPKAVRSSLRWSPVQQEALRKETTDGYDAGLGKVPWRKSDVKKSLCQGFASQLILPQIVSKVYDHLQLPSSASLGQHEFGQAQKNPFLFPSTLEPWRPAHISQMSGNLLVDFRLPCPKAGWCFPLTSHGAAGTAQLPSPAQDCCALCSSLFSAKP